MSGQRAILTPKELTPEQLGFWRNNPVTQLMLQYLADRVTTIDGVVIRGWIEGQMKLVDEQVYRGQRMSFVHIQDISWADIREFYGLPVEPEGSQPDQPTINPEPKEDDGIEIDE